MRLYSIFDRSHGQHGSPFQAPNDALAARSVDEAAMDDAHVFAKFPEEFTLFFVGEFDPNTAAFTNANPPQFIQRGNRKAL